ncbi:MAG: hypothetical protein ACOYMW_00415 [Candidatus Competibacteraceae bacterium]
MKIKDNEKFKSGVFTQIFYFNIFFGILSAFIIPLFFMIYLIILQNNGIDVQVEDSTFKSNLLSIILMIILPLSIWICYNKRDWFGVLALAPSMIDTAFLVIDFFNPKFLLEPNSEEINGWLFLTLGFITFIFVIFSTIYFFKKFNYKRRYLIAGFLVSTIIILDLTSWVLFIAQTLFALSTLFFIFYIVYRSIKDNVSSFRRVIKARSYFIFVKTLALWCPFSIVIAIGFYLSGSIDKLSLKVDESVWSISSEVPEDLFEKQEEIKCEWYNLICQFNPVVLIKNQMAFMKNKANYEYKRLKVQDNVKTASFFMRSFIADILNYIGIISNIIMCFLAVKSFFYVFARVAVSSKYGLPATLAIDDVLEKVNQGNIRKFGQEYIISSDDKEKYYMVRTLEPSGCPPKFSLPQWNHSVFSRIFTKSYTMNEVFSEENDTGVHFSTTGSSEFVEWNLKEDEQIIFHYKNFVGMTGSVKLSTIISFRLSSIVFGKVFHACATGPGKIIFLTKGKLNIYEDGKKARSTPIISCVSLAKRYIF